MKYEEILNKKEYDFLHKVENICLMGLGGSHAYGTNVETSDLDIRGIYLNPVENILGLNNKIEQVEDNATDTVIYSMDKVLDLLYNSNPNVIEILGLRDKDYLYVDEIGQMLIDNKHLFLSKRAYDKFYGYAKGQLFRLENALVNRANNGISSLEDVKKLLNNRIDTKVEEYKRRYEGFNAEVYIDNNLIDIKYTFKGLPRKKINHIINELDSIKTSLNELGKRAGRALNKGDEQISKHAMHLVRLYYMCIDILDRGEIITYREKEHDTLMNIRNGGMQKSDGNFKDEFYVLIDTLGKQMKHSLENSKLPEEPDITKISKLKEEINILTLRKHGVV